MTDADTLPVTGWWAEYVVSGAGGILSGESFGGAKVASFQPVFPSAISSSEAFGVPGLVFRQTLAPASIESLEAFGGSALNPGDIAILPQHVGSGEAFGAPVVSPGVAVVLPPSAAGGEVFGAPAISTGPVNVDAEAIGSGEAFGTPGIVSVVAPSGIVSEQAFGLPMISINVTATGVASAEGFGTPNVIGPPQAIQPAGIASLEAFGGSELDPGPIFVLPQGAASAAAFGTATIGVGPVSVSPSGVASGEAFGTSRLTEYLAPSGVPSQEAFGAARIDQAITFGAGIDSSEAVGSPTVDRAAVPLTVVGYNTVLGSSITIPAHLPGDLIILAVAQTGVSAAPTKPSASGTVPAWTTVDSTANAGGMHTASFVATASTTTSGTWGGADAMAVVVLRSAFAVGGHAMSANISATFTAPAVTLSRTDGSSVLLHFFTTSSLSAAWPAAPSGYTKQSSVGSLNTKGALVLTKNTTTSDGSVAVAAGGGFSVWQAASIEIRAY
ncbi:hypothetical protein [Mycolicibacterium fortuitum]|uniref:hypothetical protein n=1 Tax=Mycolicibacterium fortuitum TaxID=1766 RepID=UPI001A96B5F5|nr:hypothetical protein [Mycolicibacterium fortuitum]